MTAHYVWNEHTLLYKIEGDPFFWQMACKPQCGGDIFREDCLPPAEELRPATKADFDHFRVRHEGHL